jgi:putative hydrolase of the HAD superfamily
VFDLDNTLHNAGAHIFPHMNRAMTQYLQDFLSLDEVGANELRERYWLRYGATLQGLMRHHGTDPDHFLWHTHQFPALHQMVLRQQGLRVALQRLPGRKLVYSNAPAHYIHRVQELLGIADLFEEVFTIEHAGYRPKPDAHGFRRLFRRMRLNPSRCIMVEDTLVNLKTAKRLGMKTVLVGALPKRPGCVDLSVKSVLELPRALRRIR